MTRIRATAVSVEEMPDLNARAVVFAEFPDGSGMSLEIQRALSFDEQDREEGMDTYCLCLSSGACYYGGVVSWKLDASGLALKLTPAAAAELDVEQEVRVDVQLDSGRRATIMDGLLRTLVEAPPESA